jgi:carbon storage regulator
MLVLTRRPGEQIVIGDNIRITVVSIGPGRVKIGIDAPANVRIDRQEVHEKIQQEQAVDVLAAVSQAQTDEPSPTVVVGGDTATRIHNRIADKLPAVDAPPPAAQSPTPAPVPVHRLLKQPLPRKPR